LWSMAAFAGVYPARGVLVVVERWLFRLLGRLPAGSTAHHVAGQERVFLSGWWEWEPDCGGVWWSGHTVGS